MRTYRNSLLARVLLSWSSAAVLDTYFKSYFWTFHLLVLFAAAFLLARIANAFVERALSPSASALIQNQGSNGPRLGPKSKQNAIATNAFLKRNLFKAEREDLVEEVPVETETETSRDNGGPVDMDNCEKSSLPANLLATFVSTAPETSVAVLSGTGADETAFAYSIGDRVLENAELLAISANEVFLRHNGRCEKLAMTDAKPRTKVATRRPPTNSRKKDKNSLGAGVKKTGDDEWTIPKSEIDNVLSNLNKVATQARIVPSFHNGKANGFKLFSIRPNSLYSKIGIQNGDIVQKINGYEINSPDKALEIYSKLKDASGITVDLVRRGKKKSLSYSIR